MEKELSYVNGIIKDIDSACVHIEDRGYQFGEGVYEVIKVYNGKPFALTSHLTRLKNSAKGIGINFRWGVEHLTEVISALLHESRLSLANIYVQITTGTAPRVHIIDKQLTPNLIITVRKSSKIDNTNGIRAAMEEDIRWKKCWIKSTNLLANVLIKKAAKQKGCQEAIMYEPDERITEGASSNVFAVIQGVLITPSLKHNILPGITREIVLQIAKELGIPYKEDEIFVKQIRTAEEIMLTSTNLEVTPVIELKGMSIGQGIPGPIYRKLYNNFQQKIQEQCR